MSVETQYEYIMKLFGSKRKQLQEMEMLYHEAVGSRSEAKDKLSRPGRREIYSGNPKDLLRQLPRHQRKKMLEMLQQIQQQKEAADKAKAEEERRRAEARAKEQERRKQLQERAAKAKAEKERLRRIPQLQAQYKSLADEIFFVEFQISLEPVPSKKTALRRKLQDLKEKLKGVKTDLKQYNGEIPSIPNTNPYMSNLARPVRRDIKMNIMKSIITQTKILTEYLRETSEDIKIQREFAKNYDLHVVAMEKGAGTLASEYFKKMYKAAEKLGFI